jgi:hypothetical protein
MPSGTLAGILLPPFSVIEVTFVVPAAVVIVPKTWPFAA